MARSSVSHYYIRHKWTKYPNRVVRQFYRKPKEGIVKCAESEWGFCMKVLGKALQGKSAGKECAASYFMSHHNLTIRLAENIKRVRVGIDIMTLKEYLNDLEKVLENIINYDDTNFLDNPGKIKVIVRSGVKHLEVINDTSKTSTSVMIAGTACILFD